MRILFLIRSLEAGGAERQLVLLANGLAKKGHDVGVAVFYPGGGLEGQLDGPVLFSLEKKGRWDLYGFWRSFMRCLDSFQPDLLHSYMGTANNLSALVKIFKPSMKIIWGVRSSNVDFAHYGKLAWLDNHIQRMLSRSPDRIIANSHIGKKDAIEFGFKAEHFLVVHNGINMRQYRPEKEMGSAFRHQWQCGSGEIIVGIVGRLDPMKGHDHVLAAAKIIATIDSSIRFICIGGGHSGSRLEQQASDLGVDKTVLWAGPQVDMPAVYNALDICCLGSIFGEGFPNVLGEAMSCGVPCVTTDVGDAAVVVGDTGLVVPKGDPEALAKAILEMAERVRNGNIPNTRARIKKHFSLEQLVVNTERILSEVLL